MFLASLRVWGEEGRGLGSSTGSHLSNQTFTMVIKNTLPKLSFQLNPDASLLSGVEREVSEKSTKKGPTARPGSPQLASEEVAGTWPTSLWAGG